MVQGDPPPFLTVPGLGNHCLASLVFSFEKQSNVMEPFVLKKIVGENHRTYVIDDEPCFFQDLSFAACLE
jgi:hypothetical protein